MRLLVLLFTLGMYAQASFAQTIPTTKVYAFKMIQKGEKYHFINPKYLSSFNPNGYNNQPHFVGDHTLYITSQFPDDNQTDIYSLDLLNKKLARVTATVEGEYSPTAIPASNSFSAVRVEADAAGTQRLWKFPKDRSNYGQVIFEDIKGVGYHHWLTPEKVALFIVDQPNKLMIANQSTGAAVELLNNIGRGFQKIGNDKLAFIHKTAADTWYIKEMDSYTYRFKNIIETLPESEDFIYLSDGTFLMGNGSKLYKFNKVFDTGWQEVADFKHYGITNITRLAISENGTIAIVDKVN